MCVSCTSAMWTVWRAAAQVARWARAACTPLVSATRVWARVRCTRQSVLRSAPLLITNLPGELRICYLVVSACTRAFSKPEVPPNVVVEWVTPLLRIREVPGSNIAPETGYSDWGFSWVSSVPPGECRIDILKRPRPLPSKFFPIHHSLVSVSFHAI
jgi:hypothetical protein